MELKLESPITVSLSNKNPGKNKLLKVKSGQIYSCHEKEDPSKDENWVLVKRPSKKLLDEFTFLINELGFEEKEQKRDEHYWNENNKPPKPYSMIDHLKEVEKLVNKTKPKSIKKNKNLSSKRKKK